MAISIRFQDITASELIPKVQELKQDQWRFVQILAVNLEEGCDIQYSFMKDGMLVNYTIRNHAYADHIESITPWYFSAFVFENEVHDLFGVQIDNIVLDFQGHFYDTLVDKPMSIISPEQKAARDKARKLAEAKRKKEELARAAAAQKAEANEAVAAGLDGAGKSSESGASASTNAAPSSDTPAHKPFANPLDDPRIQAKLAKLPPEKAEKLKAALLAQAQKGE